MTFWAFENTLVKSGLTLVWVPPIGHGGQHSAASAEVEQLLTLKRCHFLYNWPEPSEKDSDKASADIHIVHACEQGGSFSRPHFLKGRKEGRKEKRGGGRSEARLNQGKEWSKKERREGGRKQGIKEGRKEGRKRGRGRVGITEDKTWFPYLLNRSSMSVEQPLLLVKLRTERSRVMSTSVVPPDNNNWKSWNTNKVQPCWR